MVLQKRRSLGRRHPLAVSLTVVRLRARAPAKSASVSRHGSALDPLHRRRVPAPRSVLAQLSQVVIPNLVDSQLRGATRRPSPTPVSRPAHSRGRREQWVPQAAADLPRMTANPPTPEDRSFPVWHRRWASFRRRRRVSPRRRSACRLAPAHRCRLRLRQVVSP